MLLENYLPKCAGLKPRLRLLVCCVVFSFFAGNVFAQTENVSPKETDFLEQANNLSQLITSGTIEQKRDALLRIRNFELELASRLAVPALRDKSEIVRATAAASVVFLPPGEAAQNLIPLLADKKPLVRREAAYALGAVGNPAAISALLQIIRKDKVLEVRNAAIVALGAIGDASAIDALAVILRRKSQTKEEFTRRAAARSIGQIAQIIQTGKRETITPESFLPERFKPIEPPKYPRLAETFPSFRLAVNLLIQTLQSAEEAQDVKREAAFALGAIGDESAIGVLQKSVSDADYYLAEISREALRKISASSNL